MASDWANSIPPYDGGELISEFHPVFTVYLAQLVEDGLVRFDDGSWDSQPNGLPIKWYNDDQRERFWKKFEQHYFFREIGELPYKRWKYNLLSKVALLMPKYYMLYSVLDKGIDPLQEYDEYGKSRNIYSDFPQTMLSGNEDYASAGNDTQYERVKQGDFVEKMNAVMNDYDDVDMALIRELDTHFYCLLTSNMNGF